MGTHTGTGESERDVALWRRFAAASGQRTPSGETDLNLLAAYLDGSASPAERDTVEDAMTSDPALVELLADVREMCFAGPAELPEAVIKRMKQAVSAALAKGNAAARLSVRSAWFAWSARAVAAAALVVVSFVAYQLGVETSATRDRTEADLASAVAAELRQEAIEHDLLAALGANSGHKGDDR